MLMPRDVVILSNAPFAAGEMSGYLTRITSRVPTSAGSGFPIVINAGNGKTETFTIIVQENGIRIDAENLLGAAYGVYAFLEECCGCRFLAVDCEIVPRAEQIDLPTCRFTCTPAFLYREVYWRGALDGRFALQCRLNSCRADISSKCGSRILFYNYSHTFEELVPPEKWFDTHPEYFAMVYGSRQRSKSQLCLTNSDLLRLCIEGVRLWMRENPECTIFSVAQNDWYNNCTCPVCKTVDEREGSASGSLISFVNAIADVIRDEFPHNFIHTFAYLYSRRAPRHIRPRPNVIVRICSIECCFSHPIAECRFSVPAIDVESVSASAFMPYRESFAEDLADWSQICDNLYIWDYTTNFANYLQPFPNLHVLQANIRLFWEYGAKGVSEQGNYSQGSASAFASLKIYLLAKLLWDPDADIAKHTREYLNGYFGPNAAGPLRDILNLFEKAARGTHISLYDGADAPYLTDTLLSNADDLFCEALALAETPVQRLRVEREALSIRFSRLAALPMKAANREALVDAFAVDARKLGITELFERRELQGSFECMKKSRYSKGRKSIPYTVYRL
jgi:hypothetical protein